MLKKVLLIVFIFLFIFSLGYLVIKKSKIKNTQLKKETVKEETKEGLLNIEPKSLNEKVWGNFKQAETLAQKWDQKAYLVFVQFKIPSLKPEEVIEVYSFDSPNWRDYHFVDRISSEDKTRAIIPAEDYLGSWLLPIDLKYWKMNYLEAFQLAEKEGGRDFRQAHSDWKVIINLARGRPKGWLYYTVFYKAKEDTLSVKINPYSSEVVKEEAEEAPKIEKEEETEEAPKIEEKKEEEIEEIPEETEEEETIEGEE